MLSDIRELIIREVNIIVLETEVGLVLRILKRIIYLSQRYRKNLRNKNSSLMHSSITDVSEQTDYFIKRL